MSLKYKDLQPWVDMLVDALENRGASSSGIPDTKVYPYAEKYREMLQTIREKKVSKYHLDDFLNRAETEIMLVTTQPYRVKHLLESLRTYFYKEFTK